jgi:hypothetical protein
MVSWAGNDFAYWDSNYATRVVSARIMGLEGGFSPRGEGGPPEVSQFLRGERSVDTLSAGDRLRAQNHVQNAVTLIDAAGNGKKQKQLYRGLRLRDDDPRLSAKVGDEFEMPVSAFATQRDEALAFTRRGPIAGQFPARENSRAMLIDVVPGARGHSTGPISDPRGEEVLVQGRFRVVAKPRRQSDIYENVFERLTLKQVAHYDIVTGGWVSDE